MGNIKKNELEEICKIRKEAGMQCFYCMYFEVCKRKEKVYHGIRKKE